MAKIIILDEKTACRIAAGEVVERPLSVVKELVENSLDAGANSIDVSVRGGGVEMISVVDNGHGISQEDTPLAFKRHATSKITEAEDLCKIASLGFRGEALPSIAAVSDLTIKTRVNKCSEGYYMRIRGGKVLESGPVGCPVGTNIAVRELFFNTPARHKHLKSAATEGGLINDLIYKMALINPRVKFYLTNNNRQAFISPGSEKLTDIMASIYGIGEASLMLMLDCEVDGIKVNGYISKPELSRATKQQITLAVNGRLVRSSAINAAIESAYRGLLVTGRYPVAVISIKLPPEKTDVNVHPSKMAIRMEMEEKITSIITAAIKNVLADSYLIPGAVSAISSRVANPEKFVQGTDNQQGNELYSKPIYCGMQFPPNTIPVDAKLESQQAVKKENRLTSEDIDSCKEKKNSDDRVAERTIIYKPDTEKTTGFPDMQLVGQIMNMYIIAISDTTLYIIDQHAAHERILFEKYNSYLNNGTPEVQYLLTPLSMSLRQHEKELLRENKDKLKDLGFVFDDFGHESLLLRAIPADYNTSRAELLLHDLVETLLGGGRVLDSGINYAISSMLACKAAIKGGERLSTNAMHSLIKQLSMAKEPYTCPHGRPTVISFSRRELDIMFKRT